MVKAIIAAVFAFFFIETASLFACDCSAGSIGIGLMSNYELNQVSLAYLNSRFQSKPGYGTEFSDRFQRVELSVRYAVGKSKRYKLEMHLPFGINDRDYSDENLQEKEISDVRSSVSYAILNNATLGKKSTIYLEAGAGLSLPSGKYDARIHEKNLPANFNVGRGSAAWFAQLNAIIYGKSKGVVFSSSFMQYGKTSAGYVYGSQYVSDLSFFLEYRIKEVKFIPNIALRFEGATKDRYANAKFDLDTGGNSLFLSPALNIRISNWLLGGAYSIILKNNFSDDSSEFAQRVAFRCTHIF